MRSERQTRSGPVGPLLCCSVSGDGRSRDRRSALTPIGSACTSGHADRTGDGASTILRAVSGDLQRIALSEVIGGLSYALDVTEGERPGHAVRSCLIGMRLAQELALDSVTRSHLFYALLLKDAGCSANSARMAALFGADDHVAKRTSKRVNWAGKSRRSCGRSGRSRRAAPPARGSTGCARSRTRGR